MRDGVKEGTLAGNAPPLLSHTHLGSTVGSRSSLKWKKMRASRSEHLMKPKPSLTELMTPVSRSSSSSVACCEEDWVEGIGRVWPQENGISMSTHLAEADKVDGACAAIAHVLGNLEFDNVALAQRVDHSLSLGRVLAVAKRQHHLLILSVDAGCARKRIEGGGGEEIQFLQIPHGLPTGPFQHTNLYDTRPTLAWGSPLRSRMRLAERSTRPSYFS